MEEWRECTEGPSHRGLERLCLLVENVNTLAVTSQCKQKRKKCFDFRARHVKTFMMVNVVGEREEMAVDCQITWQFPEPAMLNPNQ